MYFCSLRLGQTAGVGTVARLALIKKGIKSIQGTVFDSNAVLAAFKKADINEFFKVTAVKENIELARKYKVTMDNTQVICDPNGEAVVTLAGVQCKQTNVIKLLKAWPTVYAAWKKKNVK